MRMQVAGYFGPVERGAVSERGRGDHGPETRRRRGGQGLIRNVDSGGRGHEKVGSSLRRPSIQAGESPAPRLLPESGLLAVVMKTLYQVYCRLYVYVCVCVRVSLYPVLAGWRAGLLVRALSTLQGVECGLRMIKRGRQKRGCRQSRQSRLVSSRLVLSPMRLSPTTAGAERDWQATTKKKPY